MSRHLRLDKCLLSHRIREYRQSVGPKTGLEVMDRVCLEAKSNHHQTG